MSFLTIKKINGKYNAMTTEYEKRIEEGKIIKKEIKSTIILSLALLCSTIIFGLAAYFIKMKPIMTEKAQDTVYGIVNLVVIMLFIIIMAVKRTIYYSPRFIKESFTLTQVLQKWRTIDIVLLAIAESIPIFGLVLALLGMPFDKTFHFFLGSALLMIILMPVGIKVRSKLGILRKHFPDI